MQEKQTDSLKNLQSGLRTAFENSKLRSDENYRPQFVFNNYQEGRKVLASLERELRHCDEFAISVAFITMSGLVSLLPILAELEARNIKGRILTTNYLNFSEPKALKRLQEFKNIELKMFWSKSGSGFHTKGYMFRQGDVYRLIVGSSNLTANALTKNEEWNTKIVSLTEGEYTLNLLSRFEQLWQDENSLTYDKFMIVYSNIYNAQKEASIKLQQASKIAITAKKEEQLVADEVKYAGDVTNSFSNTIYGATSKYSITQLRPNYMQSEFVSNMRDLRAKGAKRALLISATGTGKTYASAFAVKDFAPKKMLFLVHREQIAKQALKSYRRVLGNKVNLGLLSGADKDMQADYLFATMQSMAKIDTLNKFSPDEFDLIVIDEVHRAGADSYQRIINYFQPKFYLGMTASPDRTDGYDIYALFDHNIAYEIRLQQALEEDMLCPFHYFGITDIAINDTNFSNDEAGDTFNLLTSDSRVDHIVEQSNYYGYSGDRVKGLIFCSRNDEAEEISRKLNKRGLKTLSLAGKNSQDEREEAIARLVSDEREDKLEYILSVDIFNEGVDVPEINQVIMLRPTQSPIVFIQQLGRGLRKANNKEYVVILDFIGNYDTNFMIPMALASDRSYNKDNLRRCLLEGSRIIPGASTIHFDKIAQKRIFASIDNSRLNDVKIIKESYKNLRNKLGRIPKLADFDQFGEMDVICIFQNKTLGSYYKFLCKYEKDFTIRLSSLAELFISYISQKWAEGKRPHELELLKLMLTEKEHLLAKTENVLLKKYNIKFKNNTRENLINIMTADFHTGTGKKTFSKCIFIEPDENYEDYKIASEYQKLLSNINFYNMVTELIDFGLKRYQLNYSNPYKDSGFQLYKKYEYEDVCRILDWNEQVVPLNIGGYKYDATTKTMPVFINYDKADDVQASVNYHDRFINNSQLISLSKNKRNLESEDVRRFITATKSGVPIDLFVRKNKDDKVAKSFYYLGRMENYDNEEITMQGSGESAVEMYWNLDVPVREDIYDYITSEDV